MVYKFLQGYGLSPFCTGNKGFNFQSLSCFTWNYYFYLDTCLWFEIASSELKNQKSLWTLNPELALNSRLFSYLSWKTFIRWFTLDYFLELKSFPSLPRHLESALLDQFSAAKIPSNWWIMFATLCPAIWGFRIGLLFWQIRLFHFCFVDLHHLRKCLQIGCANRTELAWLSVFTEIVFVNAQIRMFRQAGCPLWKICNCWYHFCSCFWTAIFGLKGITCRFLID